MELSELVITENGYLKEASFTHLESLGIVGIHFWADKMYKQEWRNLKATSWMRLQEEFKK